MAAGGWPAGRGDNRAAACGHSGTGRCRTHERCIMGVWVTMSGLLQDYINSHQKKPGIMNGAAETRPGNHVGAISPAGVIAEPAAQATITHGTAAMATPDKASTIEKLVI